MMLGNTTEYGCVVQTGTKPLFHAVQDSNQPVCLVFFLYSGTVMQHSLAIIGKQLLFRLYLLIKRFMVHKQRFQFMEQWLKDTLRQEEWLGGCNTPGFFNGYYDNSGRRVEQNEAEHIRMMLTSQVFVSSVIKYQLAAPVR